MLDLIDNAALQTGAYGVAAVGVALAFRVIRYPDLTADGSFILGAAVFTMTLLGLESWWLAVLAGAAAGGLAGLLTGAIYHYARVNRLLSGILTTMICYSLAFRVLSNRPNRSVAGQATPYSLAAAFDRGQTVVDFGLHPASLGLSFLAIVASIVGVWLLLRSEWGLVLRATGSNSSVVSSYGRKPHRYVFAGLFLANALVGVAAGIVVSQQGFVDVNMGIGLIIVLIAALVVGEQVLHRLLPALAAHPLVGVAVAALAGTFLYYLFYLGVLRVSIRGLLPVDIRPTDLKMLSALVVVGVILIRSRTSGEDPERAIVL